MDVRHTTEYGTFEWDAEKDAANLRKHKIDFYAAVAVFLDPCALLYHDVKHSENEERFKLVGAVHCFRIIAVFFTDRLHAIRIISARKATKAEVSRYERKLKDRLDSF